jgi:hypothetical protein
MVCGIITASFRAVTLIRLQSCPSEVKICMTAGSTVHIEYCNTVVS